MTEQKIDEKERILTDKEVRHAYHDFIIWALSIFNLERMQGPAMVKMFYGVADKFYPNNPQEQQALLKRHSIFFNTQPTLGAIVPGVALGMEEERALHGGISDEAITSIKTALMGPFAGMGDSLIQGTLMPILLSIAIGMSTNGSVLGVIFLLAAYFAIQIPLTWFMFHTGYTMGAKGAAQVLSGGKKDLVVKLASVVGLIVVGAVTASNTSINCGLTYTSGEMTVNVNDMLNSITPKFMVILFAMIFYYLMGKKKVSSWKMILIGLVIAIVGYYTHILA
jgi:mannose/fructose/N-acetylgalactosamine-specific phosphotransferase system component IID